MARGWESKEVESQIEAAEIRAEQKEKHRISAEEATVLRESESLQLSRTRVLQDIQTATNPRYREMLERSLAFLDEKIAVIEGPNRPDPPA